MLDQPEVDLRSSEPTSSIRFCKDFLLYRLGKLFTQTTTRQPLRKTAYLDGLRGFAALLVFSLHHQIWGHFDVQGQSVLENAFGWKGEYYFVCLPGIRILFSGGNLAVAIFYVISGYVLSIKPISLLQAEEILELADTLGSSIFRRWLRLYIPVICTTFLWMSSWHLLGIRSPNGSSDAPAGSYIAEAWKWFRDFATYSFVFQGQTSTKYNDQTWSIPVEFRGSLVVYTSMLAFAKFTTVARLCSEAALILYFFYIVQGWYCALFVVGMLLADLDLLASNDGLPRIFTSLRTIGPWVFYVVFAMGLYLGGVPCIGNDISHLSNSPGWYYLSLLKPETFEEMQWFYLSWAAAFIMVSTPRIPRVKFFFESRFCQYLGRISFSFYLVQGPVLWTLGDRLYAASGRTSPTHLEMIPWWLNKFQLPETGPFGMEVNFLVPQLISLAFSLLLAELATRLFDDSSVRLSAWLYEKLTVSNELIKRN